MTWSLKTRLRGKCLEMKLVVNLSKKSQAIDKIHIFCLSRKLEAKKDLAVEV